MHALCVVYVLCVALARFVAGVMHSCVYVCKRARLHACMGVCAHPRMYVGVGACLHTHNLYVCMRYKGSRHSATFGATPGRGGGLGVAFLVCVCAATCAHGSGL